MIVLDPIVRDEKELICELLNADAFPPAESLWRREDKPRAKLLFARLRTGSFFGTYWHYLSNDEYEAFLQPQELLAIALGYSKLRFNTKKDSAQDHQEDRATWEWQEDSRNFWKSHASEGCKGTVNGKICGAKLNPYATRRQVAHYEANLTSEEYLTVNEDTVRCLCRTCHLRDTFDGLDDYPWDVVDRFVRYHDL
jgi:hypothetical protein